LTSLNASCDIDSILEKSGNFPDVILVRKKYVRKHKRIWKLKHMDKDVDMESKKRQELNEKHYARFLDDIEEDKEMRTKIKMYKDDDAIKELEERMKNMNVDDKDDSDIDVKVEDLLDSLTINEKEEEKKSEEFQMPKTLNKEKKTIKVDKNVKNKVETAKKENDDEKQISKRGRDGDKLNESHDSKHSDA
jgi:hypothetical protein